MYPSYTGLEPRVVQDVRTLSVVEGTELTLICYLNKPVKSATLCWKTSTTPIVLSVAPGEKPAYQTTIHCDQTRRLKLELIDDAGRKNVKPAQFTINVLPNQPVVLKPVFPARDMEVSALEEMEVKATAWDDFGVKRFGVVVFAVGPAAGRGRAGRECRGRQKHELAHTISAGRR